VLDKKFERLRNFLLAYFNQDIESPEGALQEYIEENSEGAISVTLGQINTFLHEDLSEQVKEQFTEDNCDLYFPALELTPVEWLKQVQDEFKRAVDLG
jgi:CdiI immunity protein